MCQINSLGVLVEATEGGLGVVPQENLNMKCSWSDSEHT